MRFRVGDKVRFNTKNNTIPQWYTDEDEDNIPTELIRHGSTYFKGDGSARIVNIYNEYYIVQYKDVYNQQVRVGFKEESLIPKEGKLDKLKKEMMN